MTIRPSISHIRYPNIHVEEIDEQQDTPQLFTQRKQNQTVNVTMWYLKISDISWKQKKQNKTKQTSNQHFSSCMLFFSNICWAPKFPRASRKHPVGYKALWRHCQTLLAVLVAPTNCKSLSPTWLKSGINSPS